MPLTTSSTDIAVHNLIKDAAKYYKPESTNSKPMYKIEQLFVEAIEQQYIHNQIRVYILNELKKYE